MTSDEAKKLFNEYKSLVREIKKLTEEIMRLKAKQLCCSPALKEKIVGGIKLRHDDLSVEIIALEERLSELDDKAVALKLKLMDLLESISLSEKYRLAVFKYYIMDQHILDVARELGCSRPQAYNLINIAFSSLDKIRQD